jgi:hypothetical protein
LRFESNLALVVVIDNQIKLRGSNGSVVVNDTVLLEIRIQQSKQVAGFTGYLKVFMESFNTKSTLVLPLNMYHYIPILTTLQTPITVIPLTASPLRSQVQFSNCISSPVPYQTAITIITLDMYDNPVSANLPTILVYQSSLLYQTLFTTQQSSNTYTTTVTLLQAHNYTIVA